MRELLSGLNVSRETEALLRDFESQIEKWSRSINLVSKTTYADIWSRHILDSAQLFHFSREHTGLWLDLGSGGGLPGLVIAILLKDQQRNIDIELVESDARKAAFLKIMASRYDLSVTITNARLETLERRNATIVSARAFAPLKDLIGHAFKHLSHSGTAIFPKGRGAKEEIAAANRRWAFKCVEEPSIIDPEGKILLVSEIQPVEGYV